MGTAILGFDGLTLQDTQKYNFPGDYDTFDIATNAHTAPSWNAIFSGRNKDGLYDFYKVPNKYAKGESIASQSDKKWSYNELHAGSYVWDTYELTVTSAPVILPTYSTVWERTPNRIGWPHTYSELSESLTVLTEQTLESTAVVTVFPAPDKCIHHLHNKNKSYSEQQKEQHMRELAAIARRLTTAFEDWIIVSDHGKPTRKEWVTPDLWVASHEPTGVIASNCDLPTVTTNVNVYDALEYVCK